MTTLKLPLTMAVIAALCPISVLAQEFTQNKSTPLWQKRWIKPRSVRPKWMPRSRKADVVTEPQSAAQSPDMAIPFGIKFTGYAVTARTSGR